MSYNPDALIFDGQVVIADSTNAGITSGGLVVQGGVSSRDTFVTGHVSVNNVKITPNLNDIVHELQATLNNEQVNYIDIPDFYFTNATTRSFKAQVSVSVSDGPKNAIWELNGFYKSSGWEMTSSFTGDLTGVKFRVFDDIQNSQVKLQYTNSNSLGETIIRFRATTTAPAGTGPTNSTGIINNTSGSYIANAIMYANTNSTIGFAEGITFDSNVLKVSGNNVIKAENTSSFTNFSQGGSLTVMGDASIAKKVIVGDRIGINNTDPQFALDASGNINVNGLYYKNSSLYLGEGSVWEAFGNNVGFTIGNVGLGTTAPTTKLDVAGTARAQNLVVSGSSTVGGHIIPDTNITYDLGSETSRFRDLYLSGNTIHLGEQQLSLADDTFTMEKITATSGNFSTINSENATIGSITTTAGNVGINTTSPSGYSVTSANNIIDINADLNVRGNYLGRHLNYGTVHDSDKSGSFMIGRWDGEDGGSNLLFNDSFTGIELKLDQFDESQINHSAIIFKTWGNGITVAKEAMRINQRSNVGIGNTAPQSKLEVTGDVRASSGTFLTSLSAPTITASTGITAGSLFASSASFVTSVSAPTITASTGITAGSLYASSASFVTIVSAPVITASTGITAGSVYASSASFVTSVSAPIITASTGITAGNSLFSSVFVTSGVLNASFNSNTVGSIVTTGGNVGIGTGLPGYKLDIYESTPGTYGKAAIRINSPNLTNGKITGILMGSNFVNNNNAIQVNYNYVAADSSSNFGSLEVSGNPTKILTWNGNGNVGIGTSSPNSKLDVFSATPNIVRVASVGEFRGSQTSFTPESILRLGRNQSPGIAWASSAQFDIYRGYSNSDYANTALKIRLGGGPQDNPDTDVMTLWANGNVGIGTTSPGYKLDVNGGIASRASIGIVGTGGLTWDSYGRGIRSADSAGAIYGNISVSGTGLNSWNGYDINGRYTFMANGETVGIHDKNNGWIWNGTSTTFTVSNRDIRINTRPSNLWAAEFLQVYSSAEPGAYHTKFYHDTGFFRIETKQWYENYQYFVMKNGNVGIGTQNPGYKLDVQGGDINASGSVRSNGTALTSDQRVKENIVDANTADNLSHILALEMKHYDYTQNFLDHTNRQDESNYGFIAQQVKTIIPSAIDIQPVTLTKTVVTQVPATYSEDTPVVDNEGNPVLDNEGNKIINIAGSPVLDSDGNQIIAPSTERIVVEEIPDFHFLKKDLIFTEAVGAIQELHKLYLQEKQSHVETNQELTETKQELSNLKTFLQSKFPGEI